MNSETPGSEAQISRRTLAWIFGGALAAAIAAFVFFVLPAEFGVDPTGAGTATGVTELAPQPGATQWKEIPPATGAAAPSRFHQSAFRSDTVDIPLTSGDGEMAELEYKIRMKTGDAVVYSWTVEGIENPEEFYSEFHGHTDVPEGAQGTVMFYRKATGASEHGSLVAPFDGIHGWYLQNQSLQPVTVKLRMEGWYELVKE